MGFGISLMSLSAVIFQFANLLFSNFFKKKTHSFKSIRAKLYWYAPQSEILRKNCYLMLQKLQCNTVDWRHFQFWMDQEHLRCCSSKKAKSMRKLQILEKNCRTWFSVALWKLLSMGHGKCPSNIKLFSSGEKPNIDNEKSPVRLFPKTPRG